MAANQQDDFDVLKFFITVMILLTVIVGGFAAVLQSKVSDTTRKIKTELSTLHQMDDLARTDVAFREWIAKDREGHNGPPGSATDFQALVNDHARKANLNVKVTGGAGNIQHPGGRLELRFSMRIEGFRLEALTRFLVSVEQDWPGAKAREISELTLDEKNQVWNASVILAIFKQTEPQ